MKGFKIFIGFVGLIASGSALAGGFAPSQSNYQQFITRYRGDIIDPRLNMVAPAFVYEATRALSDDGMGDLRNPDVATFLWRSIENVVNYYANLPANVNNRDFKTRVWQSLVRSLNELANAQQPIAQPVQVVAQPIQSGAMDGVAELRDLRLRTSQIIQTNPSYFYSAGSLQPSWLRSALYAITARGRTPMTIENKYNMQAEIASAVGELMNQILRNDQRLSASQKDNIIQMVHGQVDQFINAQIASGNPEVIAISQNQGRIEQGVDALRTFRMQTAQIIQANPAYFYANGGVQSSWLQEAINRITVNGQITLTMQNQAVIEGELAGAAAELMLQLLRNDQRISPSQKESMIQAVRRQVAQFVNSRTMRSRI